MTNHERQQMIIDKYRSNSVEPINSNYGSGTSAKNHLNGSHRKIKYNHVDNMLSDKVGYKDSSPYTGEVRPATLRPQMQEEQINNFRP